MKVIEMSMMGALLDLLLINRLTHVNVPLSDQQIRRPYQSYQHSPEHGSYLCSRTMLNRFNSKVAKNSIDDATGTMCGKGYLKSRH